METNTEKLTEILDQLYCCDDYIAQRKTNLMTGFDEWATAKAEKRLQHRNRLQYLSRCAAVILLLLPLAATPAFASHGQYSRMLSNSNVDKEALFHSIQSTIDQLC